MALGRGGGGVGEMPRRDESAHAEPPTMLAGESPSGNQPLARAESKPKAQTCTAHLHGRPSLCEGVEAEGVDGA